MEVYKISLDPNTYLNTLSKIATIVRNKSESKDPKKLFDKLICEAADKSPSRPLEFLPIVIRVSNQFEPEAHNNLTRFSYIKVSNKYTTYYTNLRNFIKTHNDYNQNKITNYDTFIDVYNQLRNRKIIVTDDISNASYIVAKIKAPMFVWSQFMTHTCLSKLSQSDRLCTYGNYTLSNYTEEEYKMYEEEYWLPRDIFDRNNKLKIFDNYKSNGQLIAWILSNLSQKSITQLFKDLEYTPEIYNRAMLNFRYKNFFMGGWSIDPHGWNNFFRERCGKTYNRPFVQKETCEYAEEIRKCYLDCN